jgi:hypothetical protein
VTPTCSCGRATGRPYTTDQCWPCWMRLYGPATRAKPGPRPTASASEAPLPCPFEGAVVEYAPCNCADKDVRLCNHPEADIDKCVRGPSRDPAKVRSCADCPDRPARAADAPAPWKEAGGMHCYIITAPGRESSLAQTLASFAASDWGEPVCVVRQADAPPASAWQAVRDNFRRMLELAHADGCDWVLACEDDIAVNRHLRWNLEHWAPVLVGELDFGSLYLPHLVADPWKSEHPEIATRFPKRRPGGRYPRTALWGAQALLFSRRFVGWLLDDWDKLRGRSQDGRVFQCADRHGCRLFYHMPALVQHRGGVSAFHTPAHHDPSFDPDWRAPGLCGLLNRLEAVR